MDQARNAVLYNTEVTDVPRPPFVTDVKRIMAIKSFVQWIGMREFFLKLLNFSPKALKYDLMVLFMNDSSNTN